MKLNQNNTFLKSKWCIITAGVSLVVLLLAAFISQGTGQAAGAIQPLSYLILVVMLAAVVVILAVTLKKLDIIGENNARLEKICENLEKNRSELLQIKQNTRLSETAKAIASRDADRYSLREAVLDRLHQQDFNATYEIIDEIAHSTAYKELAEQLRTEADEYRQATDAERESQVIVHIENLLENFQWVRASNLIERLITAAPKSQTAKAMRQKLIDKKEERKKALLNTWDDAVKRQATDRSLQILRELDLYLTPNEGLALQEAARDAFRTKLHNMGVRFSLVVSGRQWEKALEIGRQIVQDFPNSKMAGEIREKMKILEQNVEQRHSS